jgi:hypothetical protein
MWPDRTNRRSPPAQTQIHWNHATPATRARAGLARHAEGVGRPWPRKSTDMIAVSRNPPFALLKEAHTTAPCPASADRALLPLCAWES